MIGYVGGFKVALVGLAVLAASGALVYVTHAFQVGVAATVDRDYMVEAIENNEKTARQTQEALQRQYQATELAKDLSRKAERERDAALAANETMARSFLQGDGKSKPCTKQCLIPEKLP